MASFEQLKSKYQPVIDFAKTRGVQTTKVVQGANRLHFQYTVDPPLKVGIYQRKSR